MTSSTTVLPGRAGSAAELAWRLERVVHCGIELARQGRCLGTANPARIWLTPEGVVVVSSGRGEHRVRHGHLGRGHDAGCATLGVPRTALSALTLGWDAVGAAPLIEEACVHAICEIAASPVGWQPDRAREAFAFAVRSRITPRAPT